jgi:RNA polymerase sigma factor (sigma-70 family)
MTPLPELAAALTRLVDPSAPGVPDAELLRRFAEARDEAAFELLVWRHGGMVLGTCRRVLGRSPDADDAFQAAFLALALRAGSVRCGSSLPGWLHRVALRAALRLRTGRRESPPLPDVAAPAEPLPDDTAAILDEEIARLPEKLRLVFVLCELEGRTDAEAATQLDCPRGTVLSRLARARERLRARLTRRGLGVAAAGTLISAPAPLTAAHVAALARAGTSFATSRTAGATPARVTALAHHVLRATTADALKPVAAGAVLAVLAAVAVGAATNWKDTASVQPPPVPHTAPEFVAAPVPKIPPAPPPNYKLTPADQGAPQVDEVRFSPDGKWLVTAGYSADQAGPVFALVVWDARTGKHVHTFTKPDGVGVTLDFSPDGKLLATANSGPGTVTLWETGTWKELPSLPHRMATSIRFSRDSKFLVTHSCAFAREAISDVRVWHTDTGKSAFEVERKADEAFYSAALAPDGKVLAVGSNLGVVRLIDTKTGQARSEIKMPDSKLTAASFSPAGDKLLTWSHGGETNHVRVWDATTGKEERKLEGDGPIQFATFSPDGKCVAAVRNGLGRGAVAWLWNLATGQKAAALVPSKEYLVEADRLSFSPDGALLVVYAVVQKRNGPKIIPESVAVAYAVPDGKELLRLPGVRSVAFNHNGTAVALVTSTGEADEVTVRGVADLLKQQ